ncbi:two-component sensor histidine kinase [Chitinimonas prasina]|uniref:histidine kinase n=1 Tax=Chitinimonas prasina TaxID=1434937 RepID=A0ABQ5YJP1_9NEIS|nr:ATP-binding protein [Chitinimonas prasina]GLR14816.1 two-component sensor histidine kinase [Chitinimonas prasina]
MLARLRPSFRQLLLLAFLLLAGLLGAASLSALLTLESLVKQSRGGAAHAVQLSADAQLLAERSVTMERAARQFLVLDDPNIRQRYDEALRDSLAALQRLETGLADQEVANRWRQQQARIAEHLAKPTKPTRRHEALLSTEFKALAQLNSQLASAVRNDLEHRNADLLSGLEEGRLQLSGQLLAALLLAILLALTFGLWLARPLRQLEGAILSLGENQLERAIDIRGPADLRRLGQRLDWLRLRLAELDADKTRFLRHISHELKTPLAALREGVALLEDEIAGPLTEQQREVSGILAQNVVALQQQIEDLLRFHAAAFEARQLNLAPCDLRALLEKVVDTQRLQWQARQLKPEIDGPTLRARVDADKLAIALGNLLSNAIRFSPQGGSIRLALRRNGKHIQIDISDQGPGIAEQDRPRIFEPFYQGQHQPPAARHGSGIGLSIVQEYLQAHGGQVLLLPHEPGTCFRIELPDEN